MSDKTDEHMIEELNETIKKKDPKEPIEKTLVTFCSKTGHIDGELPNLLQTD